MKQKTFWEHVKEGAASSDAIAWIKAILTLWIPMVLVPNDDSNVLWIIDQEVFILGVILMWFLVFYKAYRKDGDKDEVQE